MRRDTTEGRRNQREREKGAAASENSKKGQKKN